MSILTTQSRERAVRRTSSDTDPQSPTVGFVASAALRGALQSVLVELIELQLQAKQAHWNVVGTNFRDIHLELDEIVDAARESADQIAERMRALQTVPDGRSDTVVATTQMPGLASGVLDVATVADVISDRLVRAAAVIRDLHDRIDEEDPTTADILHAILISLEQHAWMLAAENESADQPHG